MSKLIFLTLLIVSSMASAASIDAGPFQYYQCMGRHSPDNFKGVSLTEKLRNIESVVAGSRSGTTDLDNFALACNARYCVHKREFVHLRDLSFGETLNRIGLDAKGLLGFGNQDFPRLFSGSFDWKQGYVITWPKFAFVALTTTHFGKLRDTDFNICYAVDRDAKTTEIQPEEFAKIMSDVAAGVKDFVSKRTSLLPNSPALFPNLQVLLNSIGLYGSDGSHLAGIDVRDVGAAVALTAAAIQTFRLIAMAMVKNPAVVAAVVPTPDFSGLTLDLTKVGLTSKQVKAFMAAPNSTQKQKCEQDSKYKDLCKTLTDLEFQIEYTNGDAA